MRVQEALSIAAEESCPGSFVGLDCILHDRRSRIRHSLRPKCGMFHDLASQRYICSPTGPPHFHRERLGCDLPEALGRARFAYPHESLAFIAFYKKRALQRGIIM